MAKKAGYEKCVHILQELKKSHPNYTMGQHLATALADYGDIWCMRDEEMFFALEKYKTEIELSLEVPEKDIDKIIEEGINLDTMTFEEDGYDDYN